LLRSLNFRPFFSIVATDLDPRMGCGSGPVLPVHAVNNERITAMTQAGKKLREYFITG